ncbi:MAG: pentapeptide repeat-containing protein [Dysgonamonadaceae bacterium]|nr:pentapeptide repeat-containing protein [Dysgonamonadaceae bacterium]
MTTKIELKRINGDIIFSHECENNSVAKTIEAFRTSGAKFDLSGANLKYADLSNTNLNGVNLSDANLIGVDLSGSNLKDANLDDTNLRWADLSDADLSNTSLRYTDLSNSKLTNTNLSNAKLVNTELEYTDLRNANLSNTDLDSIKLKYTNLSNANLHNINMYVTTAFILPQCPSEGSFVAWKKAGNMIVKLLVTEDAKRSSATTLKCRCSKARVLRIENIDGSESELQEVASSYDDEFIYHVGETVEVDDFDDNRWNECSTGIHFFIAREMAVKY